MTAVDRRNLMRRIRVGDVVVLDVRDVSEFEAGHIPGARSIPLDELESALKSLPKNREIVAYCRGLYCGLAEDAVALLRKKGYRASRIHDSIVDWKDAGLPVARRAAPRRETQKQSPTRAEQRRGRRK
ncbi:MAG: rhodanese-like domain-containing protein [Rhodospirillales bacterium]|nr:rhodanese-like domain-containing protein [Rhodospirillales bacterium]